MDICFKSVSDDTLYGYCQKPTNFVGSEINCDITVTTNEEKNDEE